MSTPTPPTTLARPDEADAIRQAEAVRSEMAERFYAYDEIRQMPSSDRDAVFQILERAQQGDLTLLRDIYQLVYEELPVDTEEFVCGRRYLGLKNRIDPTKLELIIKFDQPAVRKVWMAAGAGGGKALALDTRLPTPTGWTTMGEVQPGDSLLDEQGRPCAVLAATPVQLGQPCYRVTFDDGTMLVASDNHLWKVLDDATRRKVRRPLRATPQQYRPVVDWREHWLDAETRDTWRLAAKPFDAVTRHHRNWAIPCCRPLVGSAAPLPVQPYTLGAWLGDGTTVHAALTAGHEDAVEILAAIGAEGVAVRERPSARRSGSSCYGLIDGPTEGLRALGVLGDKHLPMQVLRADVETRLAVLQGLMDTDGFLIGAGDRCEVGIDLTNARLAAGVAELARTFGWKVRTGTKAATLNGKPCGTVYTCRFRPDRDVFKLSRKRPPRQTGQLSRHTARWIRSIERIESVPVRCVMVDSASHLYLAGESFIPTHNSFIVSVMQARMIYTLLCLKRPDLFYMLGPGSKIAAVNLSVAKEQAKDVVYAEFIGRLAHSPWFQGKYIPQVGRCAFPAKQVYAISGGSAATSFYGYHTCFGAIDEVSFLLDREGRSLAEELTEALLKSLTTRFPNSYKLFEISTLRADDDFLYQNIQRVREEGVAVPLRTQRT